MKNPYMDMPRDQLAKAARALAKRIKDLDKEYAELRFAGAFTAAREVADTISDNHRKLRQMRDAQTLRGL